MGLSLEEEEQPDNVEDVKEADIKIDLDADYFRWKEENEEESKDKNAKEKTDRFQGMLKSLASGKR